MWCRYPAPIQATIQAVVFRARARRNLRVSEEARPIKAIEHRLSRDRRRAYARRVPTASLLDCVLRPSRAGLEAARAAVAGYTDPRAAWDALCARGLIPAAWRDDPRRRFPWLPGLTTEERTQRLRRAPFVPQARCPDDVATCALLAADVEGIERAEASGRAFAAALRPWGTPAAADTVLWVPASDYGYQIHDTKPDVWEPDGFIFRVVGETRWEEVERVIDRLAAEDSGASMDPARRALAANLIGPWVFAEECWAEAVRMWRRVPSGEKLEGRYYADLPDPFARALELFVAGYGLLPSGDGALVLGYPVD